MRRPSPPLRWFPRLPRPGGGSGGEVSDGGGERVSVVVWTLDPPTELLNTLLMYRKPLMVVLFLMSRMSHLPPILFYFILLYYLCIY